MAKSPYIETTPRQNRALSIIGVLFLLWIGGSAVWYIYVQYFQDRCSQPHWDGVVIPVPERNTSVTLYDRWSDTCSVWGSDENVKVEPIPPWKITVAKTGSQEWIIAPFTVIDKRCTVGKVGCRVETQYAGLFSRTGSDHMVFHDALGMPDSSYLISAKKSAGESATIVYSPKGDTPLKYRYIIFARQDGTLKEVSRGLLNGADLTISTFEGAKEIELPKGGVVSVVLNNLGNRISGGAIPIRVRVEFISSEGIKTVAFNDTIEIYPSILDVLGGIGNSIIFTDRPAPGRYRMVITVNPDHAIPESDYDNNEYEGIITVR